MTQGLDGLSMKALLKRTTYEIIITKDTYTISVTLIILDTFEHRY